MLPRIRSYCAGRADIFHYEVERVDQIGEALRTISRVKPKVIVINGGDGTVQATLTELHLGEYFDGTPPPVAVLPTGKTNLIALDLGAVGDPLVALERIIAAANKDLSAHIVARELISLSNGDGRNRPVLGMFLGGAGLADTILYCRHKLYPLGLPNGLCHFLAGVAVMLTLILGVSTRFLPARPNPVNVSLIRNGQTNQRLSLLIITTLEKMLLGGRSEGGAHGMRLMAVDQSLGALFRAIAASIRGKLGQGALSGVHVEQGDMIRIESDRSCVILDGEEFRAETGRPIILRTTRPVFFFRLAV